jgi:hypothetical protein
LGYLMEIFRGWDQWKSAMMTLPEDVFFDLLRSVFGHVKTPFNKQNLLSDLAAFLSRDDIRRNIAAYLDEADAQVIAAVALLGNPTATELEQFFAGDGIEISALLLNLEERFILYRYRELDMFHLSLNPVLEPVLTAITGDLSRLFPSLPFEAAEDSAGSRAEIPFDDRFFAALISFVLEEESLFKAEGRGAETRLRKKVQDSARRIFPGVDPELMVRGLLCLGLCRSAVSGPLPEDSPESPSAPDAAPGPEELTPEDRAMRAFGDLEPHQRLIYWAAGLCLAADSTPDFPDQLLRRQIRGLARLIDSFLDFLSPGRAYPVKTLRRILFFLERKTNVFSEDPGRGFSQAETSDAAGPQGAVSVSAFSPVPGSALSALIDAGTLCAVLARAGLLRGTSQAYGLAIGLAVGLPASVGASAEYAGSAKPGVPQKRDTRTDPGVPGPGIHTGPSPRPGPPSASAGIHTGQGTPVLVLDAPLFCLVYPGIDFTDALALAFFTVVRETGRVFRFEITRESCLRGFERGLGAADMEELLVRLSGNHPEDSLLWTLRDWEKRSAEVSLFEGAVLALSPERYYLAEAEPLAALIRRELAPGLYLLDSGDQTAEALRKAGVDIFTRYNRQGRGAYCGHGGPKWGKGAAGTLFSGAGGIRNPFPPLKKQSAGYRDTEGSAMINTTKAAAGQVPPCEAPVGAGAEALKARFCEVLNGRNLSMPERTELASRVERKLVLAESQLSSASIRGERLEARDLDYVGKASIAKYAIGSRSLVEVVWSAAGGDGEQRILGIPLALEKSGGESILVIGDSRAQGEAETPREAGNGASGDNVRVRNNVRIPGNTIRIPLGKISLLRRIKKSMFEV